MALELWRARLGERRMTFEDLLRQRPEVLYRAAVEGALAAHSNEGLIEGPAQAQPGV